MVRAAVLVLTLSMIVAGCAAVRSSNLEAATEAAQREVAKCPSAPRAEFARCANEITNRTIKPLHPYPDLVDVVSTARLSLAVKVDRGEMSKEDADMQFAKLQSDVVGEVERRRLARRSVRAQESAGGPVSCTTIGNTVTCF